MNLHPDLLWPEKSHRLCFSVCDCRVLFFEYSSAFRVLAQLPSATHDKCMYHDTAVYAHQPRHCHESHTWLTLARLHCQCRSNCTWFEHSRRHCSVLYTKFSMADDRPGWPNYSVKLDSGKTNTYIYKSCPKGVRDKQGKCRNYSMVFFLTSVTILKSMKIYQIQSLR